LVSLDLHTNMKHKDPLRKEEIRNFDDPELRQAVYTIIKAMLDSGKVELWWDYCWVESARNSPPKTQEDLFDFIEEYWDKDDGFGLERSYLLWFNKIGNIIAK